MGYRWFDAREIDPLFPFGHGQSYTTFQLADMQTIHKDGDVLIRLKVTNTGHRPGQEIVQIYVGQVNCSVERPPRELKGFKKISLNPGETKSCDVLLGWKAFAFWHSGKNAWTVEPGKFVIEVGVSSRDLRCRNIIEFAAPVQIQPRTEN